MNPIKTINLDFDIKHANLGKCKELRDGLSVALKIEDTLWVANDESISLERLSLINENGKYRYGQHKQFLLSDFLELPVPPSKDTDDVKEVDIEGLGCGDGYLWLVGSHSLKRSNPTIEEGLKQAKKQLANLSKDGNRYLLARIPLEQVDGTYCLIKQSPKPGKKRIAAQLLGSAQGNELTDALKEDKHLQSFLTIPGKDNGFDIEGLAVVGARLLLGLRGPVLRGWAVILEVEPEEDAKNPITLRLKPIGPKQRLYRKHFLQLGGLGIRDLCVQGADILILAGPTMEIDGPVTIFRWLGGATAQIEECIVTADKLVQLADVPYGQGVDHAEGMTLFSKDDEVEQSLLIVYDSASKSRQLKEHTMVADIMQLPKTSVPKKA
ncbi:MAG: DUF3616 domain-containing protein [Pseudomonadota bacterium]